MNFKKTIKSIIFFLSLTATALLCCSINMAFADERPLLIVAEELPPFEFLQNNEPVGINVDIAKTIFKKMRVPIVINIMPWKRAWSFIEGGLADAVFSTSHKIDREPYLIYPTEEMWTANYVFFVKKANKKPNFTGYADAKNLTVGITRGNSYNEDFFKANLLLEASTDLETNIRKLAGGRIDLVPIDKEVGLATLKKLNLQNDITYYDVILFSKKYYMPFAKNSTYPNIQQIAEQFEQELIKLKASGEYDKIRSKW